MKASDFLITSKTTFGVGPFRMGMAALILTVIILLILGLTKNCAMSYIPFILGAVGCAFLALFLKDFETARSLFVSVLLILIIGMSLWAGKVC
jgi:hypothetical protein